jgi:ABC-2 type transport system permease protein
MLLRHYLRREAGALLGWCLVLPVIIFPTMAVYRLMANSDSMRELNRMIAQMPAALRGVVGADVSLALVDGWLHSLIFGSVVPLLLVVYTALAALGVLTREMDGHTLDFLLALPIRRANVLLSRLGGVALNLAVLHGVLLITVGGAVAAIGEQPHWRVYALVLLNQYLIFTALAALLVLISIFLDDLQKALITTLAIGLAMVFLPHIITPDSPLAVLSRLSLFHYYQPQAVLAHGALPWSDVAVLLTVLVAAGGAAVWLFNRKQLSA